MVCQKLMITICCFEYKNLCSKLTSYARTAQSQTTLITLADWISLSTDISKSVRLCQKNNHTQQQLQRLKASGFMRAVLTLKCRQLCRNLGFRVHFWVKAITIDFQLEKYMPFKEKYISIFSCSINVTMTSQNEVSSFYTNQTATSVVYCVEVVENVYRRTKMKN